MANRMYEKFAEHMLQAEYDFLTDDFRYLLIDKADYTWDGNDLLQFVSEIPSAAIVARSGTLTAPTVASGRFDSADITINSVTGDPCEAVVLYAYNASDAAARLVCYADQPTFVFTPTGSNVTLVINSEGHFKITDIYDI